MFRDSHDSSSFGPIGHISPVSADRLKGFIGYVGDGEGQNGRITPIENGVHARFIGDVVREGISRLSSTGNTRLSLRTIVSNDALQILATEVGRACASIEATMPVGENYSIAYIGYNATSRQLTSERRDAQEAVIKNVRQEYEDSPVHPKFPYRVCHLRCRY